MRGEHSPAASGAPWNNPTDGQLEVCGHMFANRAFTGALILSGLALAPTISRDAIGLVTGPLLSGTATVK